MLLSHVAAVDVASVSGQESEHWWTAWQQLLHHTHRQGRTNSHATGPMSF